MVDESYESSEEYIKQSEYLLETIVRRDEMVALLKIAKPALLPEIREVIARLDKSIERSEEILEMERQLFFQKQIVEKNEADLLALSETIEKELLEYVAKNKPEKLEMLKAMLSDDEKTH